MFSSSFQQSFCIDGGLQKSLQVYEERQGDKTL